MASAVTEIVSKSRPNTNFGLLRGLIGYQVRRAQVAVFQHFAASFAGLEPAAVSSGEALEGEVDHVVLGHRIDGQYAFFDRLLFDEKDTFRHFGFARTEAEESAANAKANELLAKSPYKDQLATAEMFMADPSIRKIRRCGSSTRPA